MPWLRDHLIGAVTDYAKGIEINTDRIQETMEERLRGIDPSNLEKMQELMEGGLFDIPRSPQQQAALQRLEIALALVEGWVDEVVGQATAERMPNAAKLQEAVRRRRAAGGPAEETFASLVGLELRPRRLRDASTLWGSLRTRQGAEARDGVWMSPHLLPTDADLDDPLGLPRGLRRPEQLSEDDFDAELRNLLDRGMGGAADGHGRGPAPRSERPRRRRSPRSAAWTAPRRPRPRCVTASSPTSRSTPTGCDVSCAPGHLTAGALVLSPGLDAVLLNLHGKARRWFHFGGHCEPGDGSLLATATREAREESGIAGPRRRPGAGPPRPARRWSSAGRTARADHLDVRYAALAPAGAEARASDESLDVRWWPLDGLPDLEPEMHELIRLAASLPSVAARPRAWHRRSSRRARPWRARRAGSGRPRPRSASLWPASSRWASSWTST